MSALFDGMTSRTHTNARVFSYLPPNDLAEPRPARYGRRDQRAVTRLALAQRTMIPCKASRPSVSAAGPGCRMSGDFTS